MRPKLQKHSVLELASRIIPRSGGYNTPQLAAGPVSKACFGVHTRDLFYEESNYFFHLQLFSNGQLSDLMLKKYKGKSQLYYSIFSSPKHKYTKGGLPWKRVTNLTLEVNTFT
jgi:hypothetical protein